MKTFLYKAPQNVAYQPMYVIFIISMFLIGTLGLYRFAIGIGVEGLFIGIILLLIGIVMFSYYYHSSLKRHYFNVGEAELDLPSIYYNEHFKLTTPLTLGKAYKPFPYKVIRSFYIDQHDGQTFLSIVLDTTPLFVFRYAKDWFQKDDFEALLEILKEKVEEEKF